VVIGGDAAGMSAASEARRRAPDAEIVVLEATDDVSYGACGLPYKLGEGASMEDLVIITAERFRQERRLDVRLGHRVERLLPAEHRVVGSNGAGSFELGYDKLVVATGARATIPPVPGLRELLGRQAFTLKTLGDGRALKAALRSAEPRRVAVIGAGYIGLEATEGLRERGLEVTIIEALPDWLPYLPERMRKRVHEEAARHGVVVRMGERIQAASATPTCVRLDTEHGPVEIDLVLVATGVRPNAELASEAGIGLGDAGSIAVDEQLRTSAPDVLAAGDCADARHAITGQSVWIPLALRANRAGKAAGANALGGKRKVPPVLGTAVFRFFGLEIARTGLSEAEARGAGYDVVGIEVESVTRAKYYPGGGDLSIALLADRANGRLLGASMVGPEQAAHRIDTVAAALHAGLTATALQEMDLGYAPPFGPSWSPIVIAAGQLEKALRAKA
jgi:NADPH-dependent 2,4-dienoyl-CoA reductase/sulfur reductase-like enzyme